MLLGFSDSMATEDDMESSSSDNMYTSSSDDDLGGGDDFLDWDDGEKDDRTPRNYTALSISNIKRRQDEDINQVSTVLSLSKAESCILLRHYNWDVAKVQEYWFNDENTVRIAVGLPVVVAEEPQKSTELTCGICSDVNPRDNMAAAACVAHWYCADCWMGYVHTAIHDGPGCLGLRCPGPCKAAVSSDVINEFAADEERERYAYFLLRSYVDDNPRIKWCPSPGCEFAVELLTYHEGSDVRCECLHSFCWNCSEESHHPVDCKMAAEWRRDLPEAMSFQWIISNTKPCPKCNRPIEAEGGCPHMTCIEPCKHEFCWECLGTWLDKYKHGYGECNLLTVAVNEKADAEINEIVTTQLLRRYTDYYDRWANKNKFRLEIFDYLRSRRFEFGVLEHDKFIQDALEQIMDWTQFLQWTYVYDYYLEGDEKSKKDYLKYTQGLAEGILEQLHHCVEREGKSYFEVQGSIGGFMAFRSKLNNLTIVARNHFNHLFRELALSEIGRAQPEAQKKRNFSDEEEAGRSSEIIV